MNKLLAIEAFHWVAETGSFTRAAAKMHISTAMVSKHVSQLEEHLGTKLLVRSTRSVRLTEQGHIYLRRTAPLLEALEAAEAEANSGSQTAQGELKLTAPTALVEKTLPPILERYQTRYPKVDVTVSISDRSVDLYGEDYDLAIRIGDVQSPDLVTRPLMRLALWLCASPEYLERSPQLDTPADLVHHSCLINPYITNPLIWSFKYKGQSESVRIKSSLRINNATALAEAALLHQGLVYMPRTFLEQFVQEGKLVTVLDSFVLPPMPVSFVYPQRKFVPAKVRLFIDTAIECLRPHAKKELEA